MSAPDLELLEAAGVISALDRHFALLCARAARGGGGEALLAAALASAHTRRGDVCVSLPAIAGRRVTETLREPPEDALVERLAGSSWPDREAWSRALHESGFSGAPGEFVPLVLDDRGRLYLHRYWRYEKRLGDGIEALARAESASIPAERLKAGLERCFGAATAKATPDWQRAAAALAVLKRLVVISGGPGTGKTWTAARAIALLLELEGRDDFSIALAAPTGKAASRLEESMRGAVEGLGLSEEVRNRLPEKAVTLHRLLGASAQDGAFRYGEDHPLPYDAVVVDEASMADLALASRLVSALRPGARLILLGDRDQLASVEAGAVFADLCAGAVPGRATPRQAKLLSAVGLDVPAGPEPATAMADSVVVLTESRRFREGSGIGDLARAINAGDGERAWRIATSSGGEVSVAQPATAGELDALVRAAAEVYRVLSLTKDAEEALEALDRFRILTALRRGPFGCEAVSRRIEDGLRRSGAVRGRGRFYRGRPLLIEANDPVLRLMNGETGVVLEGEGGLRAYFRAEAGVRAVSPVRLPRHSSAYAITVHKSQGSEFDRVVLVLPPVWCPLLTRELLYTAVTRARHGVEIWAVEEVFRRAVSTPTERLSGLRDRLWSPPRTQA